MKHFFRSLCALANTVVIPSFLMNKTLYTNILKLLIFTSFLYSPQNISSQTIQKIIPAAERTEEYFSLLKNKHIALLGNQTSKIGTTHLLDTMLKSGIQVKKIFCPEHGFRGNIEAGERVRTTVDSATRIKIISLYGKHFKPKPSELSDIDIVVMDIQDVGVRFYTYLSTLHYMMEACAENNKELLILDRPNPNSFYIDGPVLNLKYKSFVGLHPVPIVYGMTIGEYAQMINGEKWLKNNLHCNLVVIPSLNYSHNSRYELTVHPSPNLLNMQSIYLYPSLALFEGTRISVCRGTTFPFQAFGHPLLKNTSFTYTPKGSKESPQPLYQDELCYGVDLRKSNLPDSDQFTLRWLIFAYKNFQEKKDFFNTFFYNLSGSGELIEQIKKGLSEEEIKKTWEDDIDKFKVIRKKYLIYNE
jgi:uncharacterized protein YbbC (DUF1343 family)